ncbi:15518_t:CDS:2 [Cetraspora pellucida]|uniref:15518_t:CDS:1 n=1 Tax=Cetraspora pellucida TaxID=1433469 RepID=A0ACA9K5F9_9GLOM|nr:15518_t:CDS:2 [Cetraspora pellucida]
MLTVLTILSNPLEGYSSLQPLDFHCFHIDKKEHQHYCEPYWLDVESYNL